MNVNMGVLRTAFLLSGIWLLREGELPQKWPNLSHGQSFFETCLELDRVSFSTPDLLSVRRLNLIAGMLYKTVDCPQRDDGTNTEEKHDSWIGTG